ncbi:2-C-methyl-D-erythritol 4-phosphate cytidylyltransferase [Granulosicoccaceae sp. 1_MG-2023]|nr:2-C-methyl-D-erythritol 4-phosphate cytidylyltransferase [Granulosicoccaceae sp. 1_MG-2023]
MSGLSQRCCAVVPAAGVGSRMQSALPKQFLPLAGDSVLGLSLRALLDCPAIERIVVTVGDWPSDVARPAALDDPRVTLAQGGETRAHSVLAGLEVLLQSLPGDMLVLVHDAARPCVRAADIARLIAGVSEDAPNGGLLAVPVQDTLKRDAGGARSAETVAREGLWQAQTPQAFPLQALHDAIAAALQAGHTITDEASAMELAGCRPRLVEGRSDNIKITRPADLALAGVYLKLQAGEQPS